MNEENLSHGKRNQTKVRKVAYLYQILLKYQIQKRVDSGTFDGNPDQGNLSQGKRFQTKVRKVAYLYQS